MLRHISDYTDAIVFAMFPKMAANDNFHETGLAAIAGCFEGDAPCQ